MAWFSGKVSLGNFPDFSEAVSKLSESVKTIEKNFDNALGLDENNPDAAASSSTSQGGSGLWSTDIMSFMGQKDDDDDVKSSEKIESLEKNASQNPPSSTREHEMAEDDDQVDSTFDHGEANVETLNPEEHHDYPSNIDKFVSEEAEGGIEKSAEKDIVIDKQADEIADLETNMVLSEEAESIVGNANIEVSEEPSVDHAEQQQKDNSESDSLKNSGLPEHSLAASEDQVSGDGN